MSERVWTIVGVFGMGAVLLVGTAFILAMLTLSIYGVIAGTLDIWHSYIKGEPIWLKLGLLLIFIWTFNKRRLEKLESWTEQLRMSVLATVSYFDFVYGNKRLDELEGLGPLTKHAFWRMWLRITGAGDFADDIMQASFAKRNGRRVTIADDLKPNKADVR